jgi:hypothetical protein
MNDVVSSDSVTLFAVRLLMTTRRLSCPSYESKLDDTPIQELPHSDIDSADLEEGSDLGLGLGARGKRKGNMVLAHTFGYGVMKFHGRERHGLFRTGTGKGYMWGSL